MRGYMRGYRFKIAERFTPEQLRERRNRYHRKYMRTYKRKAGAV
jgi:hypothetical protein